MNQSKTAWPATCLPPPGGEAWLRDILLLAVPAGNFVLFPPKHLIISFSHTCMVFSPLQISFRKELAYSQALLLAWYPVGTDIDLMSMHWEDSCIYLWDLGSLSLPPSHILPIMTCLSSLWLYLFCVLPYHLLFMLNMHAFLPFHTPPCLPFPSPLPPCLPTCPPSCIHTWHGLCASPLLTWEEEYDRLLCASVFGKLRTRRIGHFGLPCL